MTGPVFPHPSDTPEFDLVFLTARLIVGLVRVQLCEDSDCRTVPHGRGTAGCVDDLTHEVEW